MKFTILIAAAIGVTLASPALSSSAVVTVSGTLSVGSYDTTGLFGDPGTDLSGAAYSVVFEAIHGIAWITGTDAMGIYVGSTAYLTINGVAQFFNGRGEGYSSVIMESLPGQDDYLLANLYPYGGPRLRSVDFEARLPNLFTTKGFVSAADFTLAASSFSGGFNIHDDITGFPDGGYAVGSFSDSPVHVTVVNDFTVYESNIPEPAAWSLMIAGFALIGMVQRNGHKRTTGSAMLEIAARKAA